MTDSRDNAVERFYVVLTFEGEMQLAHVREKAHPNGTYVRFSDYDSIAQRLAACEKDAARYRALRDPQTVMARETAYTRDGHYYVTGLKTGKALDAAIDAAMEPKP